MVNLPTNLQFIIDVSLITGHKAWAFRTLDDFTAYLSNKPYKQFMITFTTTCTMPMQYVDTPNGRFVYRIYTPPIDHSLYGKVAAWGFWASEWGPVDIL